MLARRAIAPRKKNAPRPSWRVNDAFRQWLRGRECACNGKGAECGGRMVAAHVDCAGGKGMGLKVSDEHCIPLTDGCHRQQHNKGWPWFTANTLGGRNPVTMAGYYFTAWLRTPGGTQWLGRSSDG